MKRLLFCIFLLASCRLSLAASSSQSRTVSHDDIEFYRTIIPNLSLAPTHKEIKRALKKLLRTYHPDKNRSEEAKKKYDSIIMALEKISGVKISESSGTTSRTSVNEIAAFEDECGIFIKSIHQNLHVYFSNTLERLQSDVAGGVLSLQEARKRLAMIKQEVVQITNFIATCESLQKKSYCTESERSRLEDIVTNVHGPISVQIQKELAEIQKNMAMTQGLGDLLERARVDHLLWLCKEYIAIPTNLPSRSIFLNQWLKNVQEKKWASLEEQKALEDVGKEVVDMFISSCNFLLADPLCHVTGYAETLREAIKNMKGATLVSAKDRELYNQVNAKLAELKQQQEKRSDNFQTLTPDSNPHIWAPASAASAGVHSTHHNYWGSFKSKCASGVYKSWEISKDALGKCKEGSKWFLSFAAPVALAVGHGLLNNFLAHKTGNLEQVAFFEGPWHELPIGLSVLAMHAFLGRNLYQKLYDREYGYSYQRHEVRAAAFAVFYLLTAGALQNVGERLPMCGTGWRLLMFGRQQTLFDAMFSNVSLFAGMHGVLIGGIAALCMLPDWLERSSYS